MDRGIGLVSESGSGLVSGSGVTVRVRVRVRVRVSFRVEGRGRVRVRVRVRLRVRGSISSLSHPTHAATSACTCHLPRAAHLRRPLPNSLRATCEPPHPEYHPCPPTTYSDAHGLSGLSVNTSHPQPLSDSNTSLCLALGILLELRDPRPHRRRRYLRRPHAVLGARAARSRLGRRLAPVSLEGPAL